ncbi:hypothetical protein JKP88DRAFT_287239 [Tribonema minus]|uniref:Uncharacterized protein n=1 Tax=Tribonema minus TaxID=303371 RepID=A0A835ZE78_9STRA|nr:hypothetical protein JKP88DRAFT_287239 [Tribonema minus]
MSKNSGITCLANDSASGQVLRSAAAVAEASVNKSNRFSPCSVTELTSWVGSGTYAYSNQDERHKAMVREAYWCNVIREERMQAYTVLKAAMASDFVKRAPSDVLLLDHYDWNLTPDDERLSAIRPLTAKEWMVLVKGHGVPEDLLSGTRIFPPLNYADLVTDADAFKPCKEYTFLCSITEDAFFSGIFIPRAFFLMRALRVAEECATEGVNRDELEVLRKVFEATSHNTTCGFSNNIASVFGALKRSGAERYRPDAMDIAAIRAYMPSADLAWLDTSGQALTYSVNKFIDAFRDTFLTTRRQMRADVTVSRALDRGGLKSKKAAGRLPDAEDDSLRDMMQALRKQIWSRVWQSIIAPWLRAHDVPQELQSFLNTNASAAEEGKIVKFADSKGFTRPMLATGAKSTSRMFLDAAGAPVTQRWIESKVGEGSL